MQDGVYQILGTNYYTYNVGIFIIVPFAALFLLSAITTLLRASIRKRPIFKWHAYVSPLLLVFVVVAVYWDVYQIGQQATAICREKGGIHVYKTVEVEGFLGASDIEKYSKLGFSYLENGILLHGGWEYKWRYTMKNGTPTKTEIDDFLSDYEVKSLNRDEIINNKISINKDFVVNRHTDEVLGEDFRIFIYPGWADSLFLGITGFSFSPWICSNRSKEELYSDTIDLHILKPKKNSQTKGEIS